MQIVHEANPRADWGDTRYHRLVACGERTRAESLALGPVVYDINDLRDPCVSYMPMEKGRVRGREEDGDKAFPDAGSVWQLVHVAGWDNGCG